VKRRDTEKVSAESLRAFMAVLGEQNVGIYISAAGFTAQAEREARSQEKRRLKLIDLQRFVELWVQHMQGLPDPDRRRLPLKPVYFLPWLSGRGRGSMYRASAGANRRRLRRHMRTHVRPLHTANPCCSEPSQERRCLAPQRSSRAGSEIVRRAPPVDSAHGNHQVSWSHDRPHTATRSHSWAPALTHV
jgi:hypothetical protein